MRRYGVSKRWVTDPAARRKELARMRKALPILESAIGHLEMSAAWADSFGWDPDTTVAIALLTTASRGD